MAQNRYSLYDELSNRFIKSDKFKLYHTLVNNEILKTLRLEEIVVDELSDKDVNFLLQMASIFACSTLDYYRQHAYSIAILLYTQYYEKYDEVAKICSLLLVRLGNFPAYTLIQQKINDPRILEDLPINFQIETAEKSIENRVELSEEVLYLTDFQKEIFEALSGQLDFSFAAPTSAGKSFLLILYIIDVLKRNDAVNIVYVVPTKALINQVKNDLKGNFVRFGIQDVRVLSSTVSFEFEEIQKEIRYNKHVLILTQERLSYFLTKHELDFSIDVLIVDEAQKINDGNRGVLLERVITHTIAQFPEIKVVFSSPLASNPEFFERYKPSIKNAKTNISPVHQNVLFVNTKKKNIFLSILNETLSPIVSKSKLQQACPKTSIKSKMAFWAFHLGKHQSNIVYANGASDSEELANELCQYLPDVSHPAIEDFIKFITENIHAEYSLIKNLRKGIVFHYSTMPREIKEKIEELFSNETIPVSYLCCTSTLLEGMNLPAKNVFIHKPTKGSGNKMGKFDFWNLAGRAGRLLKDFYGNIYCIDVEEWGEDSYTPEKSQENYKIISATEDSVVNKSKDLSVYLNNIKKEFPIKERDLLEQTAATFVLNYMDNEQNTVAKYITEREIVHSAMDDVRSIDTSIKLISAKNLLPKEILKKNSSIDPRLQNELYTYFSSQFYTTLLPKHPAALEFYNSLLSVYLVIDDVFLANADSKIIKRYAYISSKWIEENSIGYLIQSQIDYEEEKKIFKSVNSCVRRIVEVIDRTITYKYSKYLKCYHDILEYHLMKSKIDVSLVNLSAYLELGAYHPTTLSLLSFGLSRTTAIRLRNVIGNNNLGRTEVRAWLDENFQKNIDKLPLICREDFEKNFE